MSFPRAPVGSVSINAWSAACAAIILLVSDALIAIVLLVASLGAGLAQKGPKAKGQPMKDPTEKAGERKAKKEL